MMMTMMMMMVMIVTKCSTNYSDDDDDDDDGDDDGYVWKLTLPSLYIVLVTWRHLISNETEMKNRKLFLLLTPPLKYAWVINSLPLAVT